MEEKIKKLIAEYKSRIDDFNKRKNTFIETTIYFKRNYGFSADEWVLTTLENVIKDLEKILYSTE